MRKRVTKDEMAGQHRQCTELGFRQTQGGDKGREPGALQSVGLQRSSYDCVTEEQQHIPEIRGSLATRSFL